MLTQMQHRAAAAAASRQRQQGASSVLAWLPVLLLVATLLGDAAIGRAAAAGEPSGKKKDGMKLFHQTLSWSSDELVRTKNLQEKDISDRQAFLNHSNLAQYLGLSHVEAIHMPVPLNFVFLGFAGDGNLGVNYTTSQLQVWFGHLDHVLPHSRIELAELSCVEDGYCAGLVHGHYQSKPVHSAVHLNFTCQVVLVKQRAVMSAFERAIHMFSRPVDPDLETGMQQVDATKMEAFVDHFLSALQLSNQYTMVVMNPTWSPSEPIYGYRQGVSQKEMDQIQMMGVDAVRNLLQQPLDPEPVLPMHNPHGAWGWRGRGAWQHGQESDPKFRVNDATWFSDQWVSEVDAYLRREEDYRSSLLRRVEGTKGAAAVVQAVRVLRRLHGPLAHALREEILGDPHDAGAKLLSRFRTMHPAEDCLVSHWVGHHRWLLLDLTAGGNDWGPALGGDGVVHHLSLPKVSDFFGDLADIKRERRKAARFEGSHESDTYKTFQQERSQALASTSNAEYQAFMLKRQSWEQAAKAPGAPPVDMKLELEKWGKKYREALARAELDALERYALRHCHLQQYPPLLCSDLKEDADRLRTQLAKMTASGVDTTELYPNHMWDIFGVGEHMSDDFLQLGEDATRARDAFMAQLSGVLSKAIRHVIAPPTAVWRHGELDVHDTATLLAKHVTFDIYSILETNRQQSFPSSHTYFDIQSFKEQVLELQLGAQGGVLGQVWHQTFDFKVSSINLLDHPALASAFAVSIRTTQQEIPSTETYLEGDAERTYIDSRELAHHARPVLAEYGKQHKAQHSEEDHLVVPVLIFQLARPIAVLIDEHYNAKALEDMIVIVQNSAREDEHPTGMMCNGALVSRPLSALKDALAAVLTFLGGVLPPHIGYSPTRQHVAHDWLWSVGAHPLSATSVGLTYTQIQKDALARSYLLDALDTSIELVNRGVAQLQQAHTTHHLHAHLTKNKAKVKDLLHRYESVVHNWRLMVGHALSLELTHAAALIKGLKMLSQEFYFLCRDVTTVTEHLQCKGRTHDPAARYVGTVLTGSAAVAIGAGLFAVFPRWRRSPPKQQRGNQW